MATRDGGGRRPRCSFCGMEEEQPGALVHGPNGINICRDCVGLCSDILEGQGALAEKRAPKPRKLVGPSPKEIKRRLDEYVIGQDQVKKILSVAVHNHYRRVTNPGADKDGVELEKSNILMIGPTGSGKTLLARTLARILDVPFSVQSFETVFFDRMGNARPDPHRGGLRRRGRRKRPAPAHPRRQRRRRTRPAGYRLHRRNRQDCPPHGKRLHHARRLRRRRPAGAPQDSGRHHRLRPPAGRPQAPAAGDDPNRHGIVKRRKGKGVIGFETPGSAERKPGEDDASKAGTGLRGIEPQDLVHFGLIPEFVGRLPVVASLDPLGIDDLVTILTEPKNALIRQYKKLLKLDGVDLEFTPGALRSLAEESARRQTGARGLRSVLESLMLDIMYESGDGKRTGPCVIDEDFVRRATLPA